MEIHLASFNLRVRDSTFFWSMRAAVVFWDHFKVSISGVYPSRLRPSLEALDLIQCLFALVYLSMVLALQNFLCGRLFQAISRTLPCILVRVGYRGDLASNQLEQSRSSAKVIQLPANSLIYFWSEMQPQARLRSMICGLRRLQQFGPSEVQSEAPA